MLPISPKYLLPNYKTNDESMNLLSPCLSMNPIDDAQHLSKLKANGRGLFSAEANL